MTALHTITLTRDWSFPRSATEAEIAGHLIGSGSLDFMGILGDVARRMLADGCIRIDQAVVERDGCRFVETRATVTAIKGE